MVLARLRLALPTEPLLARLVSQSSSDLGSAQGLETREGLRCDECALALTMMIALRVCECECVCVCVCVCACVRVRMFMVVRE